MRRFLLVLSLTLVLAACGAPRSDQQLFVDMFGDAFANVARLGAEADKAGICAVAFLDVSEVKKSEGGATLYANKVLQDGRAATWGTGTMFYTTVVPVKIRGKENDGWLAIVVGCRGKSPLGGGAGQGGHQ